MSKNAFYSQSGGVTSVINTTASAVILEAKKSKKINKVFAGKNGILGALNVMTLVTFFITEAMILQILH